MADARHHHERCSCGACVSIDARSVIADRLLKDFRERHTACRERRSSESSALDELASYCGPPEYEIYVYFLPSEPDERRWAVRVCDVLAEALASVEAPTLEEAASRALARLREREEATR